ncbi:hypothetical protein [Nitrospina watsonii]|uniref:DUF2066 domain-containing protein n=1 Tax=Nitrospina watsonii TaxID=1323948 RepID=A0ABM9HAS8_9BACT|nr:hypothetical protein [Nitrospina watsonii]CAI2717241.1 conserved exported protein of unknown function [Nitrospina watsonii]
MLRTLLVVWAAVTVVSAVPVPAQEVADIPSYGYEAFGDAAVHNENYVAGRKRAVQEAFRRSLDEALRDMLGASVYNSNRNALKGMYANPESYIQSYRFLEAIDDPIEKVSRVKLEVMFFKEALNKDLNTRGVLAALVKPRTVLVLLQEKSMTADETFYSFWESVPIAEISMYKYLVAQDIQTLKRESVRDQIPEMLVLRAINGDLQASVEVGLKAAADVVVLGTAMSTMVGQDEESAMKTIQANLNVRAVSATQGTLIAAKSEIATVKVDKDFDGELKAFEKVSENMVRFLVDTLGRYWGPDKKRMVQQQGDTPPGEEGAAEEPPPVEEPPAPTNQIPSNLPPMMGDL